MMFNVKYILALFLVIVLIKCNARQPGERPVVYQRESGFHYVEGVANGSASQVDVPVIIGFHYSSSTPQEASMEYTHIKRPVRIIVPKGNFRKRDGFSYFPPDYYSKDSLSQIGISKITLDSIADFVRAIGKKYKCKPIVAGFSQGGDISFLLAIYYPELITAAFPFAGFVHRQRLADIKLHANKFVPIEIYQGEDDKIVSVTYTRKMVDELSSYFRISVKTYTGLGHDFSEKMKQDYASRMTEFFRN